jgi:hypothetical protein
MKRIKPIIWITLLILVVGGVSYSIYLSIRFEKVPFNTIDLSNSKNKVTNFSSIPYLDTLSHVMMDELGMIGVEIALHDVTDMVRNNIFKGEVVNGFVVIRFDGVIQVFIYPFHTRYKTFEVLAHEMIHVTQLVEGRLKVVDNTTAIWKGNIVMINDIEYRKREWEIEAYNKQSQLANGVKRILIP